MGNHSIVIWTCFLECGNRIWRNGAQITTNSRITCDRIICSKNGARSIESVVTGFVGSNFYWSGPHVIVAERERWKLVRNQQIVEFNSCPLSHYRASWAVLKSLVHGESHSTIGVLKDDSIDSQWIGCLGAWSLETSNG